MKKTVKSSHSVRTLSLTVQIQVSSYPMGTATYDHVVVTANFAPPTLPTSLAPYLNVSMPTDPVCSLFKKVTGGGYQEVLPNKTMTLSSIVSGVRIYKAIFDTQQSAGYKATPSGNWLIQGQVPDTVNFTFP